MPHASDSRRTVIGICVFLAAVVWMIYGQTLHHEFVNLDDAVYVSQNPVIQAGLTEHNLARVFVYRHDFNWHPLTSLSHMLDCQLYGLNAGEHHLTNVLLHGATAVLLFLFLCQMTGALWPSAFVAAVFAVHPLHVESVAWIAERKDVLSGLFFVLTLGAYTHYARKPSLGRYLLVAILFVLGLMSKAMLVTVPFVLLLLDYWPLGRYAPANRRRLFLEKLPLLALSAADCVITVKMQGGAIEISETLSLMPRLTNAIVSCAVYMWQSLFPVKLAAYYPMPAGGHPWTTVLLALGILVAVSIAAWRWRKIRPWFLIGWLWFLGMLVPVIGLVQVGGQAHADRYTYLPQIGLLLMVAYMSTEWTAAWRNQRGLLGGAVAGILLALIFAAQSQAAVWRTSGTLWTHAIEATSEENALAQSCLGSYHFQKGDLQGAAVHFQKALEISPGTFTVNNSMGVVALQSRRMDEAIRYFQTALKTAPNYAPAMANLGLAYLQMGRDDEAIPMLQQAIKFDPTVPDTHNSLGLAFVHKSQIQAAVAEYETALRLKPNYPGAQNNLAWVLATCPDAAFRNGARAVELATHAIKLTIGANPMLMRTLGAAYAEAGRFDEAVSTVTQAQQLAAAQSNNDYVRTLQQEIDLYQSRQPLRYPPPAH